jgi:two-component system chemotaxis response regulator CheB
MGRDGASGMKAIKKRGGRTIAQDEATCTVFGMPKVAIHEGSVDKILPLSKIPEQILQWC